MQTFNATAETREYSRVVGLMSGTSLDGIDAACLEIEETQPDDGGGEYSRGAIRLLGFLTLPYSDEMRARLLALCENGRVEDAARAHFELGETFAQAALAVLEKCDVAPRDVLCIGSHGQTISHLPPRAASTRGARNENLKSNVPSDFASTRGAQSDDHTNVAAHEESASTRIAENALCGGASREESESDARFSRASSSQRASTRDVKSESFGGATLQIGAAAVIAERTGITTVSDFRARDIAVGGQGAPLVPFADFRLLRSENIHRIAQNIGGIANLTWLPRACTFEEVRAFDSGPGNMVMDECARILTDGAQQMDENGALAALGKVDEEWLAREMTHPFFAAPPPKSTGREEFGRAFAARFYAVGIARVLAPTDILATATALCARSIADSYRALLRPGEACQVIVSGGGAHNETLMSFLNRELHERFGENVTLHTNDEFGVSSDAKEAVAFALLAHATMRGVPSNVPSATGAKRSVILGSITPAAMQMRGASTRE